MSLIDDAQIATSVNMGTACRAKRQLLTNALSVKLTKYEREGLETAADEQGLLISELLRNILDDFLEEYNKPKQR